MFRRICAALVAVATALSSGPASSEFMFRYKESYVRAPAAPVDEPDLGAGNDIQAWFVAPVGYPFLKEIPVATRDVKTWVKDSGDLPHGIEIQPDDGTISGEADKVEQTDTTWVGLDANGALIARAEMHFSTFLPVGQVSEVNWYTHTGEYFYSQIPAPQGVEVIRWEPLTANPPGMATRNGAFDGTPPAAGTFGLAWRGFDHLDREVAFTYGEFLVQDGPVVELIDDQVADKGIGQTFNVNPVVKHRIGSVSYTLKPVSVRPSGLTFSSTTGMLTGVYEDFDTTAEYVIEARDSGSGRTGTSNVFSLTTLPETLDLSSMPDIAWTQGWWFQRRIAAGSPNASFAVVAGQLPVGLSMTNITVPGSGTFAEISGVPSLVETQSGIEIAATGENLTPVISNPFSFTVHSTAIAMNLSPVHVRTGESFQSNPPIIIRGAEPPHLFAVSGTLPQGLAFDSSSGSFSSPGLDNAGYYDRKVTIKNAIGRVASAWQIIRVYNPLEISYEGVSNGTRLAPLTIRPILAASSVKDPATFALASGKLPAFLSINSATGVISGTPKAMSDIGTYGPFKVRLVDGFGGAPVESNEFFIEVADRPALEIVQTGAEIQRYVYNGALVVTARNIHGGVTYSLADRGNLPSTITLNTSGRLVGTTDDDAGTVYSFKVAAVDGLGYSDDLDASVTVIDPVGIGSIGGGFDRTFRWTVDRDFSGFTLPQATNTYGSVVYTLGQAPFDLQLDLSTLALNGRSSVVGTFSVPYTVADDSGRPAVSATLTFVIQPSMTAHQDDVVGHRGAPVSVMPSRINGVAPFTWEITSGRLPNSGSFAPMVFDRSTGSITGKPREEGSFPLSLKVTDSTGDEANLSFNLNVVEPLPFSFDFGEGWMTFGLPSAVAPVIENQSEKIDWTFSGILPEGVSFYADGAGSGEFGGVPADDGIFEGIVVTGTDTGTGQQWTDTVTLQVRRPGEVGLDGGSFKHRAGVSKTFTFAASNATSPVAYEIVDNAYQDHASINAATGALTVSFPEAGRYPISVKATDVFSRTKTANVTLDIIGPLELSAPASTTITQFSTGSVDLDVTNLIGSATYSIGASSSALPSNMALAGSTISGSPDVVATSSGIVAEVTDSYDSASAATDPFQIDVVERAALDIVAADYETQQYKAVSTGPTVSNAIGTVTYSIAPSLPDGLDFNPATGRISGVSNDVFDGVFTMSAVDSKGGVRGTDSDTFALKIGPRDNPEIVTSASQSAILDAPYALSLTASKVLGTLTWSLVSGTLPTGLDFDAATGVISGTPTEFGTYDPVVVSATDSYLGIDTVVTKSLTFDVVQDGSPIAVSVPAELPFRSGHQSAGPAPSAENTVGDLEWSTGDLGGTGFSIDPKTGMVSGTPNWTGRKTISLTVKDASGRTASVTTDLVVKGDLAIIFTTENELTYNYRFDGTGASGGVAPAVAQPTPENAYGQQTWGITPIGSLPRGLTFNTATGHFEGAPQQLGTFGPFTLSLKDALPGEATFGNVFFDVFMNDDPIDLSVPAYTTKIGYQITTTAPSYGNALGVVTFFPEANDLVGTNLVLDADTGVLTGSFATPQERSINVAIADEYTSRVTSRPLSLVVLPLLTLTAPQTAVVEAQRPMQPISVTAGNVAGTVTWHDLDQAQKDLLPAGVTFDTTSGNFVGQADVVGVYGPFTIQATDNFHGFADVGYSNAISLDVRPGAVYLDLAASALPVGTKRITPYSYDFLASNLTSYGIDEADLSWSWVAASGSALPPGLTLDATSGKVSGTPLESGTFTFDVTVDAGNRSATKTFVLNVELPQIELRLNAGTIPAAEAGSTFAGFDLSTLLTHVNIPKSDVTWGIDSLVTLDSAMNEKAGLPKGLTLDAATGVISGGAEETGNFRFAVTASYVENNPTMETATSRKEYTLAVTAAASYQYYRFNDSATPAGASNGVYWGMLKLYNAQGTDIAAQGQAGVSNYISSPNVWGDANSSNIGRIYDASVATGMVFGPDASGARYVGVKFKDPQKIASYYVSLPKGTAGDISWFNTYFPSVPAGFKLQGSNNGTAWVTLHTASFSGPSGTSRQWDATYTVPW